MKKYLQIVLLFILAVSVGYYHTQASEDYLPVMKKMAGPGSKITLISEQIYEASHNGEVLGYFDCQSAIGYAGPIDVLVFIDKDGKLKDLTVVKQTETPSFFERVISEGFVKRLIGKEANSRFEIGQDLDGVTNATYTSRAIAEAARQASHHIAVTQFNREVPKTVRFKLPLEDYLLVALLLAVLVFQKFKWKKLRVLTFLAGFLLIGYWQKSLLSLGNFSSLLAGTIPWPNLPFWLVLLFGILLLILITGRNLYCFWLCPYGALSEVLGALGRLGRMNYKPCERSRKRFKGMPLLLAWSALVFAFLMKNPSISSCEIFAPLFAWEGVAAQWLLLPIVLLAGVFVFRFWCRFFCPVGGMLDFLVKCRRNCVQWMGSKLPKKDVKPKLTEAETTEAKPSGKSLIFDGLVLICAVLVVVVLLQNAGIIKP